MDKNKRGISSNVIIYFRMKRPPTKLLHVDPEFSAKEETDGKVQINIFFNMLSSL